MAKKAKKAGERPWAGRFRAASDPLAEAFNASIGFDRRLAACDIRGSVAHAMALRKARVLTAKEAARVIKGLGAVGLEIASGDFEFTPDMEDIHMAVEKRLTEKIGPLGGKLHTGRSRNDQVALDLRLFLRDEIAAVDKLVRALQKTLFALARKNTDAVMPGYTHLQRAQPVLLAHHLLAYYEMLGRDRARLADCRRRADVMPLGSGALAGSPYALDREYCAKLLGFSSVTENSLDAVSDRDFVIEFLSASAILMMHLSRLAEEVILWSSAEFGYVELSDEFSTGSSLMPQKKNPDVAELARGKTGRVYGNLVAMLTVMKALPLAYNKDMQEDKEPLFDTIDTLKAVLGVFAPMLGAMKVNRRRMREAAEEGFLAATDCADYLVKKGVPFRKAHHIVGRVVACCIESGRGLKDLTMKEWRGFSAHFKDDIGKAVSIDNSVDARKLVGGTAKSAVLKRLKKVERELKKG